MAIHFVLLVLRELWRYAKISATAEDPCSDAWMMDCQPASAPGLSLFIHSDTMTVMNRVEEAKTDGSRKEVYGACVVRLSLYNSDLYRIPLDQRQKR